MRKYYLILSVVLTAALFSAYPAKTEASSASITNLPVADTYINSGHPTTTYGAALSFVVKHETSSNSQTMALIKFDVSNIPANATITDARLRIHPTYCNGTMSPSELKVVRVTSTWSEYQANWNNRPNFVNTDYGSRPAACDVSMWWGYVITDIVKSWQSGTSNYGLFIYTLDNTSDFTRTFASRESADATYYPQLNITYTLPDPVTCTSFTYSDWSTCADGSQSRTVTTSSPEGCTGGSPVLTQSCTVAAPPASSSSSGGAIDPETEGSGTSSSSSSGTTVSTADVKVPELTSLTRNGQSQYMTWDGLDVTGSDTLEFSGTADPGAIVTITIGNKHYTDVADSSGLWSVTVYGSALEAGTYIVTAQAALAGQESDIDGLVQLNVTNSGAGIFTTTPVTSNILGVNNILYILGGLCCCVLLILIIIVVIILLRKKKTSASVAAPAASVTPVAASTEVTSAPKVEDIKEEKPKK